MQSRSWTAAWTLAATMIVAGSHTTARAGSDPVVNQVRLELQIAGLGQGGCEVEIKPGHPGCRFQKVVKQVASPARGLRAGNEARVSVDFDPILAQSTSADRNCAFAITITEPGQPTKTYHRTIRLTPRVAGAPVPVQNLTYYFSSPSLAARDDQGKRPRR